MLGHGADIGGFADEGEQWAWGYYAHQRAITLINAGAKIDIKDNKGVTPLDLAKDMELFKLVSWMETRDLAQQEQAILSLCIPSSVFEGVSKKLAPRSL